MSVGASGRIDHSWAKACVIVLLAIGQRERALARLGTMLDRWPDDAYALASRAHVLAEAGRPAQAVQDTERLVVVDGNNARAWFNHGYLLELLERWDEAVIAFTRATELSPKLDRAWYGLGLVLIRLQRFEEAIAALKKNTELQPMSPYGWYQLARVHVDRAEPDEAVKIIRHLRGFEPKVAAQLERETGLLAGAPAR
jgi:tetratricopeptide (TPR) repeat protein